MQSGKGFTLIELMVVLAIIAILLTIGVPGFREQIRNSRITSATNDLIGLLQLGRSEAVTRRANIRVCGSSNGTSCDANWKQGAVLLEGGTLLKVMPPAADGVEVTGAGNSLIFRPDGTVVSASTITVCDDRGPGSSRRINISLVGQATSGANNTCP